MYHKEFSWGNVLHDSFEAVWKGHKTEEWREDFLIRSPAICAGCAWYEMRYEPSEKD